MIQLGIEDHWYDVVAAWRLQLEPEIRENDGSPPGDSTESEFIFPGQPPLDDPDGCWEG
jgi:hypothetical protein